MLTVIAGVSASGKSEYAERRALELSGGRKLYYVATMQPSGEEGRQRIARHRRLRGGKGFTTIECYRDIERVLDRIGADVCGEATILMECMSNLLANEMFSPAAEGSGDAAEKILTGITYLSGRCRHLVVVTNEVCSDGIVYDRGTEVYIKLLGTINQKLTEMADEAVEVVYSVPLFLKGNHT